MKTLIAGVLLPSFILAVQILAGCKATMAEQQPSFDCALASTSSEHLICSSSELAKDDSTLNRLFSQALRKLGNSSGVVAQQRAWLRETRDLCSDVPCMAKAYRERIGVLVAAVNEPSEINVPQDTATSQLPQTDVWHGLPADLTQPTTSYQILENVSLSNLGVDLKLVKDNGGLGVVFGESEIISHDHADSIHVLNQEPYGPSLDNILLEKRSEHSKCPVRYQIIAIKFSGQSPQGVPSYEVGISDEFGSCGDNPRVTMESDKSMTVTTRDKGDDIVDNYKIDKLTEKRVTRPTCVNYSGSSRDLLPCNSCELDRKVKDAMADFYDERGGLPMGAAIHANPDTLALQESHDQTLNALVYEALRKEARPNDIKVCVAGDFPVVTQYRGLLAVHGAVTDKQLNSMGNW